MKPFIYSAIALSAALIMASCMEDKGNYDYIPTDELMPVKIGGMEPEYNYLYGATASINPVLNGITDEGDMEYVWCMYNLAGTVRDTIGRERNLNVKITQSVGKYRLVYVVRERKKGDLYVSKQVGVNVGTIFSDAWFIVEDDGSRCDVDLLSSDGQGNVREDIVTESVGARLEGKGVKIALSSRFDYVRDNPDGTTATFFDKTAFYICAQKDMKIFNSENMELFYDFGDCFYEEPEVRDIRNVDILSDGVYLNNNGNVHYYDPTSSVGKFSAPNIGVMGAKVSVNKSWYSMGSEVLVFDEISRSFFRAVGSETLFGSFAAPDSDDFGPTAGMGKDMADMLFWKNEYIPNLYAFQYYNVAVMKDAAKSYIYTIAYLKNQYPFIYCQELPLDFPVAETGAVRAMHSAQNVMFFSRNGNELHRFEIGREELSEEPILFPGETIVYMRHFRISAISMDCLGVLTNTQDGNWKFYMIPFVGGSAELDRGAVTLTGTGKGFGRYVMRMRNNRMV